MTGSRPALQMGNLNLAQVRFHPRNVRRDLGDLRDLVASIREVGVLQPISVDWFPDFLRLRAGHRRVAAARLAGLVSVPGVIHRTALTDEQFVVAALHENLHRRDLGPAERAAAIEALRANGLSVSAISERLGVSDTTVRAWSSTTPAAPPVQVAVRAPAAVDVANPAPVYSPLKPYRPSTTVSRERVGYLADHWRDRLTAGLAAVDGVELLRALDELAAELPPAVVA